jgi:hypothetical protein
MGEAVGLVRDAPPAARVIERKAGEAEHLLSNAAGFIAPPI